MPPKDRISIDHMIDAAGDVARLIADRHFSVSTFFPRLRVRMRSS